MGVKRRFISLGAQFGSFGPESGVHATHHIAQLTFYESGPTIFHLRAARNTQAVLGQEAVVVFFEWELNVGVWQVGPSGSAVHL